MRRTRERGSLWKLFRENTKTFLDVTFGMIPDSIDQMLAGMQIFVIKINCTLLLHPFCVGHQGRSKGRGLLPPEAISLHRKQEWHPFPGTHTQQGKNKHPRPADPLKVKQNFSYTLLLGSKWTTSTLKHVLDLLVASQPILVRHKSIFLREDTFNSCNTGMVCLFVPHVDLNIDASFVFKPWSWNHTKMAVRNCS